MIKGVTHSKKNLPGTISIKMDIDIYTTTTVATFNLEEQFKAKKKRTFR